MKPLPLTWEEIQKLNNCPVWIKIGYSGFWAVIEVHSYNNFMHDCIDFYTNPKLFDKRGLTTSVLHRFQMGEFWEAYRDDPHG